MTSIKSLFLSFIIGGLTLGLTPIETTNSTIFAHECEVENTVFQAGEQITYVLYYNLTPFWIKAGEVTFTLADHNDHYYVEAVGKTASSFEWFYEVHDVYTCQIDKETLRPIRSTRTIREGSYRKVSTAEYDFENNQIIAHTGKTSDNMKRVVQEMDECMHDVLSIIYHTRNLDFDNMIEGATMPANIFLDDDKYNVGFKYMGREEKKIKKLGKVDAIVLKPQLVEGYIFEEDTEMTIWASDDGNKLPLMVESPISVGSVKAVLKSYENLRYPLEVN